MDSLFNKTEIKERAKAKWDSKNNSEKHKSGYKYRFLNEKLNLKISDWIQDFDKLKTCQKNVLIKGELIRTYDFLPNHVKTKIMRNLELSAFYSKWYRLPPYDKEKLLNYVLCE